MFSRQYSTLFMVVMEIEKVPSVRARDASADQSAPTIVKSFEPA